MHSKARNLKYVISPGLQGGTAGFVQPGRCSSGRCGGRLIRFLSPEVGNSLQRMPQMLHKGFQLQQISLGQPGE